MPSVSDYDGNTYPVIEINGVKWLAANLRTTHYNDGAEMPVVDGGTDASDALTAPAACITENNADYREKYGLLYNYYAGREGRPLPERLESSLQRGAGAAGRSTTRKAPIR